MKKKTKKLVLAKETVAWLTKEESKQAEGGLSGASFSSCVGFPCPGVCWGSVEGCGI